MSHRHSKQSRLPTVRRLPMYLRFLRKLAAEGHTIVSSNTLAEELNFEPIVVRKDLAITGVAGKPRIGFSIPVVIEALERFVTLHDHSRAFLAGAGNLGSALMGYKGFGEYGLNIVAAFDTDPIKIGTEIYGRKIYPLNRMVNLGKRMNVYVGILCVPEEAAQIVTDIMVRAGIRGIWNFTPTRLKVPDTVVVVREDLTAGLAVLSVLLERMSNTK